MINIARTAAPILMLAVMAALAGCHSGTAASSVQSAAPLHRACPS
jgi:hypothetical protein